MSAPAESFRVVGGASAGADTLVMISVLQSVRDVPRTLQAAYNAIRPGGWLVFSDRGPRPSATRAPHSLSRASPSHLTRAPRLPPPLPLPHSPSLCAWCVYSAPVFDARWDAYRAGGERATPFWDVGHPCAIKQTVIDHFLSAFEEVHASRFVKDEGGASRRKGARMRAAAVRDEQLYFIGRKPMRTP